jgi:hypothetical protein
MAYAPAVNTLLFGMLYNSRQADRVALSLLGRFKRDPTCPARSHAFQALVPFQPATQYRNGKNQSIRVRCGGIRAAARRRRQSLAVKARAIETGPSYRTIRSKPKSRVACLIRKLGKGWRCRSSMNQPSHRMLIHPSKKARHLTVGQMMSETRTNDEIDGARLKCEYIRSLKPDWRI